MPLPRTLSTLLWLPWNVLQGVVLVVWTAGWILVALAVSAVAGPTAALAVARRCWAPLILAGAGVRLRVVVGAGSGLGGAALVVANHQSWIDIPALLVALPVPLHFVAKRELAAVPLLGWYIRAMGMVFVERRDPRAARVSVERVKALLAAGHGVVSFPEGTRSRDGRLHPFKSGGFAAALAAGAPVVPVGIVGAGRVLPAGGFRVRPGTIVVRIGVPIATAPFAPDDRAGLARAAEHAVAALLGEAPPPRARSRS
jgi:1-acyl-sn-glycerol-3-phosphate acyltransferase